MGSFEMSLIRGTFKKTRKQLKFVFFFFSGAVLTLALLWRLLYACSMGLTNWRGLMDVVSHWNTFCCFGQQRNCCWLCLPFLQLLSVGGHKPYLLHMNGEESSPRVPGIAIPLEIKQWLQSKPLHCGLM